MLYLLHTTICCLPHQHHLLHTSSHHCSNINGAHSCCPSSPLLFALAPSAHLRAAGGHHSLSFICLKHLFFMVVCPFRQQPIYIVVYVYLLHSWGWMAIDSLKFTIVCVEISYIFSIWQGYWLMLFWGLCNSWQDGEVQACQWHQTHRLHDTKRQGNIARGLFSIIDFTWCNFLYNSKKKKIMYYFLHIKSLCHKISF